MKRSIGILAALLVMAGCNRSANQGAINLGHVGAFSGPARESDEQAARLATCRGFYVPSLYEVHYHSDGTIARFEPRPGSGAPAVVKKAAVKSADRLDPPATSIFTPDTEFGSRFLSELFFLMIRRPPRSTPAVTLFPDTALFRSVFVERARRVRAGPRKGRRFRDSGGSPACP